MFRTFFLPAVSRRARLGPKHVFDFGVLFTSRSRLYCLRFFTNSMRSRWSLLCQRVKNEESDVCRQVEIKMYAQRDSWKKFEFYFFFFFFWTVDVTAKTIFYSFFVFFFTSLQRCSAAIDTCIANRSKPLLRIKDFFPVRFSVHFNALRPKMIRELFSNRYHLTFKERTTKNVLTRKVNKKHPLGTPRKQDEKAQ